MIILHCPVLNLHAVSSLWPSCVHFSKSLPPLGYGAPPDDLEELLAYRGTCSGTGKLKV